MLIPRVVSIAVGTLLLSSSVVFAQDRPVSQDSSFDKKAAKSENLEARKAQEKYLADRRADHRSAGQRGHYGPTANSAQTARDQQAYLAEKRDADVNPHHTDRAGKSDRPETKDGRFDKKAAKQENLEVRQAQEKYLADRRADHRSAGQHGHYGPTANSAQTTKDQRAYQAEQRDAALNPHHTDNDPQVAPR